MARPPPIMLQGAVVCVSFGAVCICLSLHWWCSPPLAASILLVRLLLWISLPSYSLPDCLPPSDSYLCSLALPSSSDLFSQSTSQCMCWMSACCFRLSISVHLAASSDIAIQSIWHLLSCCINSEFMCKHVVSIWNGGVFKAASDAFVYLKQHFLFHREQ